MPARGSVNNGAIVETEEYTVSEALLVVMHCLYLPVMKPEEVLRARRRRAAEQHALAIAGN